MSALMGMSRLAEGDEDGHGGATAAAAFADEEFRGLCVQCPQALLYVRQPDAAARAGAKPHAVVLDAKPQPLTVAVRADAHAAAFAHGGKPVPDGVLEQGLEQQRRHGLATRSIATRELHTQAFTEP